MERPVKACIPSITQPKPHTLITNPIPKPVHHARLPEPLPVIPGSRPTHKDQSPVIPAYRDPHNRPPSIATNNGTRLQQASKNIVCSTAKKTANPERITQKEVKW